MNAPSGMVLGPGVYLIEVRTDPSVLVPPGVLRQALEQAGFTDVVLDEGDSVPVPPNVGASPAGFSLPKPSSAAPSAALSALHAAKASSAAPLSAAAAMHMTPEPPTKPATPGAARVATALRSPAATSVARTQATSTVKALTAAQQMAAAQAKKTGNPFSNPFAGPQGAGGGGEGGGVDQGAGSGGDLTFTPDPNDPRYADCSDGSRYYLDPDTGVVFLVDPKDGSLESVDQQTLKPTGQRYPKPAPMPAAAASPATSSSSDGGGGGGGGGGGAGPAATEEEDLGGGPIDASTAALIAQGDDVERAYGEDPAYSLHVGAAAVGGDVLRAVARTTSSITLRAAPSLRWSARPLAVDPYVAPPLPMTTRPFPLVTGAAYEVVVLSRDRRARSRGDVWTLAEAMGFEPQAIALLARDLHLPRRLGSYSRWLLVGVWKGPATITTAEEPLLFADVARTA